MKVMTFLSLILALSTAWAQVPPSSGPRQIYSELMMDFYDEILTMDAVVEPQAQRQQAIEDLKAAMQSAQPEKFHFASNLTWATAWPPKQDQDSSTQQKTFEQIPAPHLPAVADKHSIKDLAGYIKARLGSQAAEEIRSGKVMATVIGGEEASLKARFNVSSDKIFKLPSLYESWGIKKYLVSVDGQKPILAYLVPPAREYLEHYQMMLTQLTGKEAPIYRSSQDFQKWKSDLADGVRQIGNHLGGKFDYVVLGYYNQWPEILKGQILEQKEAQLPSGHMGRSFKVQAEGRIVRILTLGHNRTIWGEASAFLVEGAFEFRPRAIFFLGSAGSISNKTQVYQISAPQAFRTKQSEVEIGNLIHLAQGKVTVEVPVQFSAVHGNTSSPASQTLKYLTNHAQAGVDTLDVEQSLIAANVARYNQEHSSQIKFGAVNLITDKPLGHAENDLDRIDHSRKAKARLAAVRLTYTSLLLENQQPTQCARVH